MIYLTSCLTLALLLSTHGTRAAFPQVDFERMGRVGLAGAFAGLDVFSTSSVSFDPTTSTLLSRAKDGSLTRIASTNSGGTILAGCMLGKTYYLAGSFSSINSVAAANIAAYNPSTGAFSQFGSGGPNGEIHSLYCDSQDNKVWTGGRFSSPGGSVAVFDPKAGTWSSPPFGGITGAQALVTSIASNSSGNSLLFTGSFVASFGNSTVAINGTNNPNVPFSPGASPFSSSLVPIPLQNVQVDGSPSSSQTGFSDIRNTLCPSGVDGPGNSWFAADRSTPLITVRTFSFISANGVRLGNTFQPDHGTTAFSLTTIPDNIVRTLKYFDPTTRQNVTCQTCPLSTDSSILYQDFLFDQALAITGVQIKLTSFTGSGPGLHILQLLSSGAFASSITDYNRQSCFAPNPSNTTQSGQWLAKVANTGIAGTVQTVLVASANVGTPSASAPSFTWIPYVSAAGNYDINLLVPGCSNFQDCAARTSVKVVVFPGGNLPPYITDVSQQNSDDATVLLYSGPILPSSPSFVTTISMELSDSPTGTGQSGQYELVADRVQLILKSANINATTTQSGSGSASPLGSINSFGFLEWPRSQMSVTNVDGRKSFPNSSITALDSIGINLLNGMGGATALSSSKPIINALTFHTTGYYIGGSFALTSGPASSSSNIVAFKNGALAPIADGGLNGDVLSMALSNDQLYVGGSFKGTRSGSAQGLNQLAVYNIQKNTWSALGAGVDGVVTKVVVTSDQLEVAGNFTKLLASSSAGIDSPGFAVWDIKSGSWVNSGGFIVGKMTFVDESTSSPQYMAGNIAALQKHGASGLVMLKNGDGDGPEVSPLSIGLSSSVSSPPSGPSRREPSSFREVLSAHLRLSHLFGRQIPPGQLTRLPPPLPATAPAVLGGAFWVNSSTQREVVIFGGNFSFFALGSTTPSEGVAIFDPDSHVVQGLAGSQIQGTVRTVYVDGNALWLGGEFTIPGTSVNGLALYDLAKRTWAFDGLQALQASPGSKVVVRSISKSESKPNIIVVAGSFALAGSLPCAGICSFDTQAKQWFALGNGILGEVASVVYAGTNNEILIAAGAMSLPDTPSYVAKYSFSNATWVAVGSGSDIPGPVEAVEVNNGNSSSLFAAGKSSDGTSFLTFWDGVKWTALGSAFAPGTIVADLTMVPLTNTHAANGIIEPDRMLMISGALATSTGNASSALYDGQNFIPYIVSTSASGTAGSVSSLFHSFSSFSFNQRKFMATAIVIIISIAISAAFIFILALIGILWTLFSRKDDKIAKFDTDGDDDSVQPHPSALLEHIAAATRTTILGPAAYSAEKEEEKTSSGSHSGVEHDPFGPDASNYLRAETPSDAIGGILAEETSRPAHARYSFDGTGEGELQLSAGAEVEVLDDRDPAWWYARDVKSRREGVVPAAYLY